MHTSLAHDKTDTDTRCEPLGAPNTPRTHAQPKQGGYDCLAHSPTVSAGMGFAPAPEAPDPAPERTVGALKPCRGRAPKLLREPSGARGKGTAHVSPAGEC